MSSVAPATPAFNDLLLHALDHCSDTVVATRPDGVVVFWNHGAGRVLHYTAADMVGKSIFDRVESGDAVRARLRFATIVAGQPFEGSVRARSKTGDVVTLRLRVFAHRDATGTVTGVICLGNLDTRTQGTIMDHALWGARLAEWLQIQAMSLIAGGLAHDLNNQVTTIGHTAELAVMLDDPSRNPQFFGQVQQLCERSRFTIERIQDFSRANTGRQADIDLAEITAVAVRWLRAAVETQLHLVFLAGSGKFPVRGNANQIQEVLIHLIRAAEAELSAESGSVELTMKGGGEVSCASSATSAVWCFRMPGRVQPELWRRLIEADFSHSKAGWEELYQLATRIHSVLVAHGCHWSCQGDVICLEWRGAPVAIESETQCPAVDPKAKRDLGGLHIAVVVDDPFELEVLREILQKQGARVSAFRSAVDFLRWLPGGRVPDLLVVDQVLEALSGEEVARQLLNQAPGVPVLMTGGCIETGSLEIAGARCIRTLSKPFVAEELMHVLLAMR